MKKVSRSKGNGSLRTAKPQTTPVRLEDIALATGFDKSTVSVALRDHPRAARFSQETRDRIRAAAEKLGYRPNFFAQQLTGVKPRMLMLCLNYLHDPFAMMVAEGFESRAAELGMRVLITALQDRHNPLDLHRDIIGLQGIPAIALIGGDASRLSDESLRQLASEGVKIMLVNRAIPPGEKSLGRVGTEDIVGGRLAAEHVYAQGVKDVWILGGMAGRAMEGRVAGFTEIAEKYKAPSPQLIHCAALPGLDWAGGAAAAVTAKLKAGERPPQAILTVSDVLALGAARVLNQAGLRVGKDIAIVGYDDGLYAQSFWPPLTTVHLPMAEMGRSAAEGLIAMLENPTQKAPQVVLPVTLTVRESGNYSPNK